MNPYEQMKKETMVGWNTYDTRSVLSHVLLPCGFGISLGVKEYASGQYLGEALIGRFGDDAEVVTPYAHAYDGAYTKVKVEWRGIAFTVESATVGEDVVLLVKEIKNGVHPATLALECGFLWGRSGYTVKEGDTVRGVCAEKEIRVYTTANEIFEPYIFTKTPYFAVTLAGEVGFSTGIRRTVGEIKSVIAHGKAKWEKNKAHYGENAEIYDAMQTCLAWDTVYDPLHDRIISPVSRVWNLGYGGYSLYCWDMYFAAAIAAVDNKPLAYANAIEMTREHTERGFVPNFAASCGMKTRDRSEPPVGSMMVRMIYQKYRENWFVEEVIDDLLRWNDWYCDNRMTSSGNLTWGSDAYTPVVGNYWEYTGVHERFGAALESGLDNSPMYDDVPFDKETGMLTQADVGLTSLIIADCRSLVYLCDKLGRKTDAARMQRRLNRLEASMEYFWSEEAGFYFNRDTVTGKFNPRISPTNFYPLFAENVPQQRIARMLEHFYNPEEFYGAYMLPSISRNDPAYHDQEYWRGRIWAPMNFLVYLAFREKGLQKEMDLLSDKSQELLLKEWREHGHVHENYNGDTGEGCDVRSSDRFYHWGGLLGLIGLSEQGYF